MSRINSHPQVNSSVVVGRMLASEGFSPKLANNLRRYAKRQMTPGQLKRYERIKRAMSEVAKRLCIGDRMVIGRFISWQTRIGLDTGLRIGIAATYAEKDEIG